MKKVLSLIFLALLPMVAVYTFISCGDDDVVVDPGGGSNNGSNINPKDLEIIVTIDADGKADGGHYFTKIDENNFYIDDIKYTAKDGNLKVTGYNKALFKGEAKIINTLVYHGRHMKVTDVGGFEDCKVLTSIIIPNSVTRIGSGAFWGCSSLTSITFGNSVNIMDDCAFHGCKNLTIVHITDLSAWCKIKFVETHPLRYAQHLYLNGKEIKDLTIPSSVTSIGENAFRGFSGLTSVTIPNNVTSIGFEAFSYCSGLKSVNIGSGVTSIGNSAFNDCSSLTSITIPNSVTRIGSSAFAFCSSLTSITIPNSVTSIGDYAFYGCSGLTSITIGNSVTSIGGYAFSGCSNLKNVFCYPTNPPSISSSAFKETPISSATLHVPVASIESYKAANYWRDFGKIVAI